MKKIKLFVAVLSCTATSLCMANGQPERGNQRQAVGGCQTITQETIHIPFTRAESGHILVDGLFNQTQSKTVVDTGGIGVGGVVSQTLYDSLDVKRSSLEEVEVQGAMHSNSMKITQLNKVGVAGAKANGLNFVISPRDVIPNIEALLGSEFLCSFLVEFDFKNSELILHPKSNAIDQHTGKKLVWGKADFSNKSIRGAITMDMSIESKPVVAVLDTGARHSIMNWAAAKLIGIEKDSHRVKTEKNTARGIHGKAPDKSYKVQLDSLSLAGENRIVQKDMIMRVADLSSFHALVGNKPAINLGVDFFNERRLLIDYSNQQIAISE